MSHTILLVQSDNEPETRTYSDYKSVNECMKGVCKIYEEHLKKQNLDTPTVAYNFGQLFNFIDQFKDLSCLVYQESTNTYVSYDNDWIKERIHTLMYETPRHTKKFMKMK